MSGHKITYLSTSLVALVFLLTSITCSLIPSNLQSITPSNGGQIKSTETKKMSKLGQVFQNGDLAFAIQGWETSKGDVDNTPERGNQYLLLDILIANQGDKPIDIMLSTTFKLRDAEQVLYQYDFFYRHNEPLGLSDYFDFPAREQARGKIAFQVPEASSGYILDVTNGENTVSVALDTKLLTQKPPIPLILGNPNAHHVGETLQQGNITFEIKGWGRAGEGLQPREGYKFLVVDLMLGYKGPTLSEYSSEPLMLLRDEYSYLYNIDYRVYVDGEDPFTPPIFIDELNMHKQAEAKLVFEVLSQTGAYFCIFFPKVYFGEEAGDPIVVQLMPGPTSN